MISMEGTDKEGISMGENVIGLIFELIRESAVG